MKETQNILTVIIDGVAITAPEGRNLLTVCLENNIYVPHLCYLHEEDRPATSCRFCFVEITRINSPVPACTITIEPDLQVQTTTEAVRRLQRSALRLLLSAHDVDCKNCHANHHCELQNIAKFLKISLSPKPLTVIDRPREVDSSHPFINHYPHRCVLCDKCIRICQKVHGQAAFSFAGRGIDTVLRHYPGGEQPEAPCPDCRSCVDICPVGALKLKDNGSLQA